MKIRARVIPNSKVEGVAKKGDGFLIRVKEPAKEGRANKAVIKLLAEHFEVSQRQVVILSGFGSRNKVIEVLNIQ